MALDLDVHVAASEHADERIDKAADPIFLKPEQLAPGERDEAACLSVELVERERALAFRRAHFHPGDQSAQVSVAFGGFNQDRHTQVRGEALGRAVVGVDVGGDRQLGADDGFDAGGGRGAVEARGAVHAVAIEQGDGGISVARGLRNERLR